MTSEIQQNIENILQDIPASVKLVAVSKTKPIELLRQAYDAGQRDFGENKAQEMAAKYQELPEDIRWHFIGHLQTNKVKYMAPFVSLIHAVDSLKVLHEINKQAIKNDRIIDCLLEFHIAEEESKFGLSRQIASGILNSSEFREMKNIRICGVMGMATYTPNEEKIKKEFQTLKEHFNFMKEEFFSNSLEFKEISMGMSGDYLLAIEEGATIVRVGSKIFGSRE